MFPGAVQTVKTDIRQVTHLALKTAEKGSRRCYGGVNLFTAKETSIETLKHVKTDKPKTEQNKTPSKVTPVV